MTRRRAATEALRTEALLVRAVPYREADLLLTLFTAAHGLIDVSAPSARRSSKRFQGLEALHLLRVGLELGPGGGRLTEAAIERPRLGLLGSLDAALAAGRALRWVRAGLAAQVPDEGVFRLLNELLDTLDAGAPPEPTIAARGLALVAALGWALELDACVRCGKPVPPGASACLDRAAGGVVCRACGGGPEILRADERVALRDAQAGDRGELPAELAVRALAWIDQRLARG